MAVEINIDVANKIAYLAFSGEIGEKDLVSAYSGFISHREFNKTLNSLWDFSKCSLFISYQEIQRIAEMVIASSDERGVQTCSAFISRDVGDRALLTTYITKVSRYPTEFELFSNIDEAEQWLLENLN